MQVPHGYVGKSSRVLFVRKGKKQRYKDAAAAGGYSSLNEFIETAMDRLADEILGKE